jgi:cell division protein ZapB
MDAELKALEEKLGQLIELCQRLRADNNKLRQDLAASVNANKRLTDKVELAANRLEGVLAKLPESD